MLCPKCYGKVNKNQNRCEYCGFDLSQMQGATNKQAKIAKHTIYKDDILYTTNIPPDVSKKKLLLLAIFLGLFGAHNFYVGKFWQGLFMCLSTAITAVLGTIVSALGIIASNNAVYIAFQFILVFQGLTVIFWVADCFKIFLERFKIPVYKDSFSNK